MKQLNIELSLSLTAACWWPTWLLRRWRRGTEDSTGSSFTSTDSGGQQIPYFIYEQGWGRGKTERTGKARIRNAGSPAVGEACEAIMWLTPRLKQGTYDSFGFLAEEILISASTYSYPGLSATAEWRDSHSWPARYWLSDCYGRFRCVIISLFDTSKGPALPSNTGVRRTDSDVTIGQCIVSDTKSARVFLSDGEVKVCPLP